jgi:transcriptional regulator with XRE-family HTH domain
MPRDPAPDPRLGKAIRRLREDRGLTRERLAFAADVTTGAIARIELSQSVPSFAMVASLAEALDVTLVELGAAIEAEP